MPKNVQTTAQLCSFHMLAKLGLVVCELRTSRCTSWIYKRQRNQRSNCQLLFDHWKSKREKHPEKHLLLLYWQCQSVCAEHHKLWKILKEMGIPDHITCLLRNLFAGQEATVRTGHRTTDWIQIREGVWQGCILSPCLFKLFRVHHVKFQGWMKHMLESRLQE